MTLPNKLTIGRLLLGLGVFACLWLQRPHTTAAALGLYLLATITDWVDGYIARRTDSVSTFGKMADPIADKVLVIGALIAFVRVPDLGVPAWAVFLIMVRELLIGGLRALAGVQGVVLAADRGGKWKMIVQSVSIILILILMTAVGYGFGPVPRWIRDAPFYLVLLSMVVSLLSGFQYAYNSRGMLRQSWSAPEGGKP